MMFQSPGCWDHVIIRREGERMPAISLALCWLSGHSLHLESHTIAQGKSCFILWFLTPFSAGPGKPQLRRHWEQLLVLLHLITPVSLDSVPSSCQKTLLHINSHKKYWKRNTCTCLSLRVGRGAAELCVSLSVGWGHVTLMYTKVKKIVLGKD